VTGGAKECHGVPWRPERRGVPWLLRAGISLAVLLAALAPSPSWSQVQIIRELPQTGENQAQADWRPPLPSVQAPAPQPGAQLSGRISLGASGGVNESGARSFDTFTESNLSLLLPMGAGTGFLLSADANRNPRLDGLDQTYKGDAKLTSEAWQAEVAGGYVQHANNQPSGSPATSSDDTAGDVHAAVTMSMIPTLPINATYSYQRLSQKQSDSTGASSLTADEAQHQAQLKAVGTLGAVGVDTGASFSNVTDAAKSMETTGFDGRVGVTVPVASFLKAYATLMPKYNAASYSMTGNDVATTSLESDAGVIFPVSESFSFRMGAGRVDQWSRQSGPSANTDPTLLPYSVTWKGTAGVEWKQPTGFSASSNYAFGKTVSGPYIHSLDALVAWHGQQDDALKEIQAGGTETVSLNDSGTPVYNQATWKASLGIGDQNALAVAASYTGSVDGISQISLTNTAHAGVTDQVASWFSWSFSGDLSNSMSPDTQSTFVQTYQGKIAVTPRFGESVVTFAADDSLSLDLVAIPNLIVSKAGAGVSVPVLSYLTTRYRFDWEWDSVPFPGATAADSNYRNALGFTISGQGLPVSLTTEYALSFGFRGLRHDGTLSLTANLLQGFAMTMSVSVSEYASGGAPNVPFLARLNGTYTF